MRAIMVMFDSLNRHMLPAYGCDWVHAPNFHRLAERTVAFDNSYVGSMPCMPCRREFHTGRYNFLHRSWGPLEPFDDSVPEILQEHGIYTYLGKVLDLMDELDMWKDTLLLVCTDHGFLLGEHDWWAKVVQPFWNEIARTPLFLWDPRIARSGERCQALVQNIDWGPTLLEFFGVPLTRDMQGIPLTAAVTADHRLREAVLFGIHGGHVNVTDGRYLYMRAPVELANRPLYEYTLMPTHMRHSFAVEEATGRAHHAESVRPGSIRTRCS